MTGLLDPRIGSFEAITLGQLNEKSALLDRQEHKYLLQADQFLTLVNELSESFYILEIDGNRIFQYRSMYFDTEDFVGYAYHNQGRTKRRFKVRTRQYVDSGLCFFEVKMKDKRGGTIKKRIAYSSNDYKSITNEAQQFLRTCYEKTYGHTFKHDLAPKLEVVYNRITLVAKAGGERMTIDFNLTFSNNTARTVVKPLLIVETKSADGRGHADVLFKKYGIRSQSCSKYCLGVNMFRYKVKYNRFKPLLKMYRNLPPYVESAPTSIWDSARHA